MFLILFVPSFILSRFSTSPLICRSVLMRRVQLNLVVDLLHGIPVFYCLSYEPLILFSNVSSASLISQSGSFALPAVMGCTGIALLPRYTLTACVTIDTASELGVRVTFWAISQSIIINKICGRTNLLINNNVSASKVYSPRKKNTI